MEKRCQSFGMPMSDESMMAEKLDGSKEQEYCKYCVKNGKFIDDVDMEVYIDKCAKDGAQAGMSNAQMKEYCEKLFPTLKRWNKSK